MLDIFLPPFENRRWSMFGVSSILSTLLLASQSADLQFHDWCSTVGISTPLAKLETTERSIAGRGVFATKNIEEGDIVITIPEAVVLHEYNAATIFPELAEKLWKCKLEFEKIEADQRGSVRRMYRHLFKRQRRKETFEFVDSSDLWQATLTLFSLACLDEKTDHPWKFWVSQWQRIDPMQSLFENVATWRDKEQVVSCVDKLSKMLPDVSATKLRAAVETRLGRLEELKQIFDLEGDDDEEKNVSTMFGIMTSRAVDLGDGVLGVLPMFDMLNHSNDPNLALSFDGETFSLWATRDIAQGQELFVCYKDRRDAVEWDEHDAIWMLVQWGIPLPKPASVTTTTIDSNKEKQLSC